MFTLQAIQEYGMLMDPKNDMKTTEALAIIKESKTKMEVAGNSYTYGYMKGVKGGKGMVPILNIKQISDDEWNEMARRQRGCRGRLNKLN